MKADKELDKLINSVSSPKRRPCKICRHEQASRAVSRWVERRAKGDSLPTLRQMHLQLFSKIEYASYMTYLRHCNECLQIDITTGKPHA